MHPEVIRDEPGACPKCGMTLVPRETAVGGHDGHASAGHGATASHGSEDAAEGQSSLGHGISAQNNRGNHADDHGGHGGHGGHGDQGRHAALPLASHSDAHKHRTAKPPYSCPMHPEVVSDTPGNCPKCGMTLVKPGADAAEHRHGGHGHGGHSPHDGHGKADHAEHDAHKHEAHKHEAPSHDGHGHSGHGHSSHGQDDKAVVQYTCPMHPEVVSDTPGNCPKCGMTLVEAGSSSGDDHGAHAAATYTCPMHPEVVSDAPGSCPKCGMFLVEVEPAAADDPGGHDEHSAHGAHSEHGGHGGHGTAAEQIDGIEPGFMSMVDLTKDMPVSPDGLKMEWIDVPFGPFFPGLPGGLGLSLTLDGDTVAAAQAQGLAGTALELPEHGMAPAEFSDSLAAQTPLSPVAMGQLVSLALQNAAGVGIADDLATAHVAAVERERICSHLGWIATFAGQSGLIALERRAGKLQLALRKASTNEIARQSGAVTKLLRKVQRTPMLRSKLVSIGRFDDASPFSGPVARAAGIATDARQDDPLYQRLGFSLISGSEGDAMARLTLRCDEIIQSFGLIARAGTLSLPQSSGFDAVSAHGSAVVETPRGAATLSLRLDGGKITEASLVTPSAALLARVGDLTHQMELADALVAVASLDLDPWGAPA
ncbi:heavy metal-binding domain-containing protein [Candidatus Halocynthiibacter alkanivorans]|uniref:heavy metal-binding domain-containing protein n=1 Tax=Candidatus Halocynthiibacter alkanivorans TaxID=2267619 RepID=UPI001F21B054|nr:heavy metal-binding domain-containing protein [Candidatus Halocynthiibacter alkanivorans]